MAPRRAAFSVAVLVLLAGCVGIGLSPLRASQNPATTATGSTADAAETTTAEITDGTADTATTTSGETDDVTLPPGANATGIEDAEALVTAHREALNETGFAFRFRANVSVGPAVQRTVLRGTVDAGLSPLLVHSSSVRRFDDDVTEVRTDLWANASTVAVQHRGADGTDRRRYDRSGDGAEVYDETFGHLPRADLGSQVTQSWLIELALTVGDYRLARTERRDGRLLAEFRATEPVAAADFTDLNATVVVDGEGRVHAAELTASAEGDDVTRVRYEFELTETGNVTVERPAWVDAATAPNQSAAGRAAVSLPRETARRAVDSSPHPPRSSRLDASVRV